MTEKVDRKTAKLLDDGRYLTELIGQPGWKVAKRIMFERLVQMDSIDAMLLDRNPEETMRDILVRKQVINEIRDWFKTIEGTVAGHAQLEKSLVDERVDDVMLHLQQESDQG